MVKKIMQETVWRFLSKGTNKFPKRVLYKDMGGIIKSETLEITQLWVTQVIIYSNTIRYNLKCIMCNLVEGACAVVSPFAFIPKFGFWLLEVLCMSLLKNLVYIGCNFDSMCLVNSICFLLWLLFALFLYHFLAQ